MKKIECEECEGTGKRSFYECDELVNCVDCDGTGKQTLASESQREAAGTADGKSDGQAENEKSPSVGATDKDHE